MDAFSVPLCPRFDLPVAKVAQTSPRIPVILPVYTVSYLSACDFVPARPFQVLSAWYVDVFSDLLCLPSGLPVAI